MRMRVWGWMRYGGWYRYTHACSSHTHNHTHTRTPHTHTELWTVFQPLYTKHIEQELYPVTDKTLGVDFVPEADFDQVEAEEDEEGEAGETKNDEIAKRKLYDKDGDGDYDIADVHVDTPYFKPRNVSEPKWEPMWNKFRKESDRAITKLLCSKPGHKSVSPFHPLMTDQSNTEKLRNDALEVLGLTLFNDTTLTSEAVHALYMLFSRRKNLAEMMLSATLVLEEQDKDTLRFIEKRKMVLVNAFNHFR